VNISYTNAGGETLTFRQTRPYFLQRVDGTGSIRQAVNTFRAPNQDGAFFISGALEMRNITLEGAVLGDSPEHAGTLQKRLLHLFTPKQHGTLVYRDARIPCVVEEIVFAAGEVARTPTFFISLLCPSPFFEALDEVRVELAAWIDKFSFPLEIPASGMELGQREPSQIIIVNNVGDVQCGCTVSFTALGTLTNPEIMNVDNGEVFRLLKTMSAGEELRVFTHFAGKRVVQITGGVESNAFQYMDTASTFLQLAPGLNTLRYSAVDNMDLLEVTVFYRPLYLGAT
jgi:hypothetical protein